MANKFSSEVDSFLFHLIGEEESVSAHRASTPKSAEGLVPNADGSDLDHLESAEELGANFSVEEFHAPSLEEIGPEEPEGPSYRKGIPVIFQVRRLDWEPIGIDDFRIGSRVGDVVTGHASVTAIRQLGEDPDVIRIDVSRETGLEELDVSVPAVRGVVVHRPPIDERGRQALIGVIDGGLDVLHRAFLDDDGKTRIVEFWDQEGSGGQPPVDDKGRPRYGRRYTAADIDGFVNSGVATQELRSGSNSHGTHVTSIAAGRAAGGTFVGGMAPEAGIVFVRPKLETPDSDPRSIGYSMAHVDALAFMDRVARSKGLPVVVNISLGMNAGAHDGTSTLEAAFDNFTSGGRMPGRVIVKSAGNAGADALHAQFQIGQKQIIHLQWTSKSVRRRDDVIEVWYNSSDHLNFSLIGPGGVDTSPSLNRASNPPRINGRFATGNDFSMTLDRFHRDNGDTRLSLRITRGTTQRIASGIWTLRVEASDVPSAGIVDAWIERTKTKPIQFITHISVDGTLSIPGTANTVISVAALDRQMQGQVMSFSSRGTTRDGRRQPDIGAPGNAIIAAQSGTLNGVIEKRGTSMAAPHVSGAIALLLSQQHARGQGHQLNANQIRAALGQSSQGYNGHWNSSRGWGMLDAEALLQLFG